MHTKTESPRQSEGKREKEHELSQVQGMCLQEPGKQMADRHAVAFGSEEEQHEENIMGDIQIGKRGSERQQMKNNLTN